MMREQQNIARNLIEYLQGQQGIKSCTIHGSLGRGMADEYSDIDLQVDVSGHDNGRMALMLPYIVEKHFPIAYVAFAPKFAPDLYLVSFALSQTSIFHFIDIECLATPHVPSLQKDDIRRITNRTSLCTKLLIGCLKTYMRQKDCSAELQFLARQLQVTATGQTPDLLEACFSALHTVAHKYTINHCSGFLPGFSGVLYFRGPKRVF